MNRRVIRILDTHAVFRWRWGLFPAFDVDQIEEFDPDFFVTLIDDVDEIHERLQGKRWSGFSLKDIMVWREEEILGTDLIAKVVSERKRKEVPNYILARGHHPSVLQKLISQNTLRKIYLSFGITGLTQAEKDEVRKFRQRMSELFIAFDPYKIEERGLKITKETVEEELNTLVEDKTHAFSDCFEQRRKEFEKAAEGSTTVWKAPSRQAIQESFIRSVNITFKKQRNEREDEISMKEVTRTFSFNDIQEIGHDIDGQIILRDFRLIDQSDMIVAFIGVDEDGRPIISAGSQTEIKYASETQREDMSNGEAILYTIPGSISCQRAEDFLKESGVKFKVVSIRNVDHLESVGRDIEVQKLPLLVTSESKFQGLKEIMSSAKESK